MTQQMFIDFITKKVENKIKDSHSIYDTFCRTLVTDPEKVENWIRKNIEGWKIFAILETGEDVYGYYDWGEDLIIEKIIENFKKVFLKLKLVEA